jgi:uncharacterized protein YggE
MRRNRFALVLLAVSTAATAQQPSQDKHFIRASADAVVTGKPDRANISIGVQTQGATAKASAEQNATETANVMHKIKTVLGTNGEIKTTNYSISPHYEMNAGNNRQSGFDTNDTVEVTVDDLSLLPRLLDAATGSGANSIGGISFTVKDNTALRQQALTEASEKAKAAAEAIAKALGLRVVGVASAEAGSSSGPVRPMPMRMMLAKSVPSTPIESGSIEVSASVTVTLEVNP